MESLEKRFALKVKHLPRDKVYLAGISGGRDSVVLLRLLLRNNFGNIIVCHLDHGTRKRAKDDLILCRKLAEISQMRFISDNLARNGVKSEGSMRRCRMEFFARTALLTEAEAIFLGHHADDLAETFLWNLLRGSGADGLKGIESQSEMHTACGPIRIYRPMLDIWRTEIDAYAKSHSIDFVEDATNKSKRYTRNRLRLEIIPWLEKKLGRNIRENLSRTAEILREESAYLDTLTTGTDAAFLDITSIATKAVALQRRIILNWLRHNGVAEVGFEEVELVRALLSPSFKPSRVNLSQNRQARRKGKKISLSFQHL